MVLLSLLLTALLLRSASCCLLPSYTYPRLLFSQKGVAPSGVSAAADAGKRLCSFDGDADRLVYHFFDDT